MKDLQTLLLTHERLVLEAVSKARTFLETHPVLAEPRNANNLAVLLAVFDRSVVGSQQRRVESFKAAASRLAAVANQRECWEPSETREVVGGKKAQGEVHCEAHRALWRKLEAKLFEEPQNEPATTTSAVAVERTAEVIAAALLEEWSSTRHSGDTGERDAVKLAEVAEQVQSLDEAAEENVSGSQLRKQREAERLLELLEYVNARSMSLDRWVEEEVSKYAQCGVTMHGGDEGGPVASTEGVVTDDTKRDSGDEISGTDFDTQRPRSAGRREREEASGGRRWLLAAKRRQTIMEQKKMLSRRQHRTTMDLVLGGNARPKDVQQRSGTATPTAKEVATSAGQDVSLKDCGEKATTSAAAHGKVSLKKRRAAVRLAATRNRATLFRLGCDKLGKQFVAKRVEATSAMREMVRMPLLSVPELEAHLNAAEELRRSQDVLSRYIEQKEEEERLAEQPPVDPQHPSSPATEVRHRPKETPTAAEEAKSATRRPSAAQRRAPHVARQRRDTTFGMGTWSGRQGVYNTPILSSGSLAARTAPATPQGGKSATPRALAAAKVAGRITIGSPHVYSTGLLNIDDGTPGCHWLTSSVSRMPLPAATAERVNASAARRELLRQQSPGGPATPSLDLLPDETARPRSSHMPQITDANAKPVPQRRRRSSFGRGTGGVRLSVLQSVVGGAPLQVSPGTASAVRRPSVGAAR